MNKYLLEILQEASTIIIPGLGALTITNKEKGEIMFMPYLKHDDSKLSGYIAQKDGIDEADAKNLVAKYVREIQSSLDKGDSFDMFEFGKFSKNEGGDIEFTASMKGEKESTEPKVTENKEEKPAEPTKEEIKAEKKTPVKKKATPKKETPEKTEKAKPKKPVAKKEIKPKAEEVKKVTPPVEKIEAPETKEKFEETKPKKITPVVPVTTENKDLKKKVDSATKDTVVAAASVKEVKPKKKKGKKKRGAGFRILMVLLLLIISGGTYFGINYDEMKQYVPFLADEKVEDDEPSALDEMKETLGEIDSENGTNDDDDSNEETIDDEEQDGSEEIIEEVIEDPVQVDNTPPPASSGNGPYHIVAGAFSSQENANRLAKKLQDAGLPASVIINGGMHTVSMKSFANAAEANSSLSSMKEHASSAWVLYKP